jgi:hypothetical protein
MRLFTILQRGFLILPLVASVLAGPHVGRTGPSKLPLPSKDIFQFPKNSWIENLAVRSDGDLLLTLLTAPQLYLLDPSSRSPQPQLVYNFPDTAGLLGITELQQDMFYVITTTNASLPNTYALWEIGLSGHHGDTKAVARKVTAVPDVVLANSVIPLYQDYSGGTVLISDSGMGVVWQVDVNTGDYSIIVDVPEMKPVSGATVGINGLQIRGGFLYWTNSGANLFYRVKVNDQGTATGPVQIVGDVGTFPDDFAFDWEGTAWIALGRSQEIGAIQKGQHDAAVVLGVPDQLTVAGPTSARFGRGPELEDTLYVVTCGGIEAPINGTIYEGAKVLAVDTRGFHHLL